jgi:hypothetical protein
MIRAIKCRRLRTCSFHFCRKVIICDDFKPGLHSVLKAQCASRVSSKLLVDDGLRRSASFPILNASISKVGTEEGEFLRTIPNTSIVKINC